jgi:hypothetical protein
MNYAQDLGIQYTRIIIVRFTTTRINGPGIIKCMFAQVSATHQKATVES